MNYMAPCGSDDCSTFDASTAQWFKISEAGQDSTGKWVQGDVLCTSIRLIAM